MSLIMPKQTGERDRFEASLAVYYENRDSEWVSNKTFKYKILERCPELKNTKQDAAMLVKQSEICRYFGLVERPTDNMGAHRSRITKRGIKFYEAIQSRDSQEQTDLIFQSLAEDSFGRNNGAVPNSDSRIDPPVVFLKAIQRLGGISRDEFAYILYQLHDYSLSFEEVMNDVIRMRQSEDDDFRISDEVHNKYSDIKFVVFFKDFETKIVHEKDHKYYLTQDIENSYGDLIDELSPYNDIQQNITMALTHKDIEKIENSEVREILETEQEKRETEYARAYNLDDNELSIQNNRSPQIVDVAAGKKYKTNPRIRKTAVAMAEHKCEIEKDHQTFLNSRNKPYMEAHHLIPMEQQPNFNINIDRTENIVSLCSTCHNQIHYGNKDAKREIIERLIELRRSAIDGCRIIITDDEIKSFYGI